MATVKMMPEAEVLALLAGHEDILTPRMQRVPDECPFCKGAVQPMASSPGIVRCKCLTCGMEMDPETGFISKIGSPSAGKDIVMQMVTPVSSSPTNGEPSD